MSIDIIENISKNGPLFCLASFVRNYRSKRILRHPEKLSHIISYPNQPFHNFGATKTVD